GAGRAAGRPRSRRRRVRAGGRSGSRARAPVRGRGRPVVTAPRVTGGIDVGAGAVKAAVVESGPAGERIRSLHLERIHRRDPAAVAEAAFELALARAGVPRADIAYVASPGHGDAVHL